MERPCAGVAFNQSTDSVDSLAPIVPHQVVALDGTPCAGRTAAGVAATTQGGESCIDLGIGEQSSRWRQLAFLPEQFDRRPAKAALLRARRLHEALDALQLRRECSSWPTYTVAELPMIGTCATIEYGMLALALSSSSGSRLIFGRDSARVWTSTWLCGRERSLGCYFDVSGPCCAADASFEAARASYAGAEMHGAVKPGARKLGRKRLLQARQQKSHPAHAADPLLLLRKRKGGGGGVAGGGGVLGSSRALSLGGALAEFNVYGTAWVSGQLIAWLFGRMHPAVRAELLKRRAAVFPPRPSASSSGQRLAGRAIGLHVRRGDSCALGSRLCPRNLTAAYFLPAARLRSRYGINRLVLATDDVEAAALCAARVLGFECTTAAMDRVRFASFTSIERRVVHHASGLLSGGAVSLDALADVDMLADCDAHVLVFRSALSRLAYALSTARKGFFTPLVSLQWPWGGMPGPRP